MSIRHRLLEALNGNPETVFSGAPLGAQLGVSRTAIWKQIKALKDAGFPIQSTGRQGYRIKAPFDSSLISFQGPPGIVPHYFVTTLSTQALAKAGAHSGLPEGHLWMAETQSKGRGRLDRLWESRYGGLWFSLLLRPPMSPVRVAPITLLTGLALREAVETVCGVDARLKWPNDLLIRSNGVWKKLAGILTEMTGQIERTDWVVIGVGLNVHNGTSEALAPRADCLYALTGKIYSRSEILGAFLSIFFRDYRKFKTAGFAPFRQRYWKQFYAPDGLMRLKTASGEVTGVVRGVDAGGSIMIECRRKIRLFSEGEIVLPSRQ